MASCNDWIGELDGAEEKRDVENYDDDMDDYYSLYTTANTPPDMFFLSYPSVRNPDVSGAPITGSGYEHFAEFYRVVILESLEALNIDKKTGSILAVGSGLGGVGQVLDQWYPSVDRIVCTDLVKWQVEAAQERVAPICSERVEFEVGDITKLDNHADHSFDIIYDEVIVSHLRGPYRKLLPEASRSLKRVLKKDGVCVLSGYCREIEGLAEEICATGGWTEVRRTDITKNNAVGGADAIEYMFGAGSLERLRQLLKTLDDVFGDSDATAGNINKIGLWGKVAATLCDQERFAAIINDLTINGAAATGCQDMPLKPKQTGAVPVADLLKYGSVIDAILFGCRAVIKRLGDKPCWVITLKPN